MDHNPSHASFYRCIFKKNMSNGFGESVSCSCYRLIMRYADGEAMLDVMDAWQEALSPPTQNQNSNQSGRSAFRSNPNRRLYNRRCRLSSSSGGSSNDTPVSSPVELRQFGTSWVEAPEFFPSSSTQPSCDKINSSTPDMTSEVSKEWSSTVAQLGPAWSHLHSYEEVKSYGHIYNAHPHRHNNPDGRFSSFGKPRHHNMQMESSSSSYRESCSFCIRIGRDKAMYDSHCLRNPITGAIMCPELKRHKICHHCGDTGDDFVHSEFECPKLHWNKNKFEY